MTRETVATHVMHTKSRAPTRAFTLKCWFRRHPFRKGDGWAVWGGIGILLAPFVVAGTAFLVSALGYPVRLLLILTEIT